MITLQRAGFYKLIETHQNNKILYLDADIFVWIEPRGIGAILVSSHTAHEADCVLSSGHYRLYDVEFEPALSDQLHLELEVGHNFWQGYILPTGLPGVRKNKARIISTTEVITENPRYKKAWALDNKEAEVLQ